MPRELSPSSARDVHGWVDNYWEQEARWLGVRVERLERQLRRRTVVLGSSLVLLSGGAVGAIVAFLFSMPPFDQHHQLAEPSSAERPVLSAPTALGVTLPVPLAVAAPPAERAGDAGPTVQPRSPGQIPDRARRAAELGPATSVAQPGSIEPMARRAEPGDAQPPATPGTPAPAPSPPAQAEVPADPAGATTALRTVLSDIKRQMRAAPGTGHPEADGGTPPRLARTEPPLAALTAREPTGEAEPLPATAGAPPPAPAASAAVRAQLPGARP